MKLSYAVASVTPVKRGMELKPTSIHADLGLASIRRLEDIAYALTDAAREGKPFGEVYEEPPMVIAIEDYEDKHLYRSLTEEEQVICVEATGKAVEEYDKDITGFWKARGWVDGNATVD